MDIIEFIRTCILLAVVVSTYLYTRASVEKIRRSWRDPDYLMLTLGWFGTVLLSSVIATILALLFGFVFGLDFSPLNG